jgi:hypothetical protein
MESSSGEEAAASAKTTKTEHEEIQLEVGFHQSLLSEVAIAHFSLHS